MADTGLTFTSDGSSGYIRVLKAIEDASSKLDKALKKVVGSSAKFNKELDNINKTITSSTRRINSLVDRLSELEVQIRTVANRFPSIARAIEQGFAKGKLDKFMNDAGQKAAAAFIEGVEDELQIRSPSRVMQGIGVNITDGLTSGLSGFKDIGSKIARGFLKGFKDITNGTKRIMNAMLNSVKQGVQKIQRELDKAGQSLKDTGAGLMGGGFGALAAGGLIAGATIGAAALPVANAVQFEQAMKNAQSILGATNEEMEILNAQILEIGGDSTVGVFKASEAFFDIVSGVQDATTHIDILNAAIATSEAGQADLTAVTSGLIAVMNSYSATGLAAADASNVFSRTVQMGVGTMDGFVAAMSPIAGLSAEVGVEFEELGTAMAFLTSRGATTGAAATRLQGVMVAFLKPTTEMQAALQALGFESGQAAIQELGLVGALNAVNDELGGNADALAGAFGRVEALQGAMALLNDGYTDFAAKYNEGLDDATMAARATQMEGMFNLFNQITAAAGALSVEIGTELFPIIRTLGDALLKIIEVGLEFIRNNRELAGALIRVAVVGGVVVGGLIAIGGAIAIVTGAFAIAAGSLLTFTAGLAGIAALFFSPIGIIAALAAVAIKFLFWEQAVDSVGRSVDRLTRTVRKVRAGLQAVLGMPIGANESLERENELLAQRQALLDDIESTSSEIVVQQEHQVEAGDTLWDLAQKYGTTVDEIMEANLLDSSTILIGQELVIPVSVEGGAEADAELRQLEADLEGIDRELEGLDGAAAAGSVQSINQNLTNLVASADLAVTGLMAIFGGDVTGGMEILRQGIDGVKDSLSALWADFMGGFQGADTTSLLPAMSPEEELSQAGGGAGTGENPIIAMIQNLVTGFENFDSSAISQAIADNMGGIIDAAVTIFKTIIGFPVGALLGLVDIIGWAIESDFMGLGTWLEQSGIRAEAERVFTDLVTDIQSLMTDAIGSIFGGGGGDLLPPMSIADELAAIEVPSANPFQGIIDFFQPLIDIFTMMSSIGIPILQELGTGIQGFFANLFGTVDAEQLGEAGGVITDEILSRIERLGMFLSAIAAVATVVGSGLLSGLASALPEIGTFIGGIVNLVSAALTGDVGGMWDAFVGGLVALWNIVTNFTVGAADGVITAIENIAGIELPSSTEAFAAWTGAFDMAWQALSIIIDNIKRDIQSFTLGIQDDIISWIAGMRNNILAATGVDIAPEINIVLSEIQGAGAQQDLQDAIGQTIGGGEPVTVDTIVEVNGLQISLGEAAGIVDVENFGEANKLAVEQALATAAQTGDVAAVEALLPLAIELDLDIEGIVGEDTAVIEELIAGELIAGDTDAAAALIPMAADIGVDVDRIVFLAEEGGVASEDINFFISTALDEALTSGDVEAAEELIPVAASLGFDIESVVAMYEGTEGYEAVRQALIDDLASEAAEGDEEAIGVLLPVALAFDVTEDEVVTTANESGLVIGDEVAAGLHTALGIASPSQVAIDAGMNITLGLAEGMKMQFFMIENLFLQMTLLIRQLPIELSRAVAVMNPMTKVLTNGFSEMADSAKGLWKFLQAIKLAMAELGLTQEQATAAVMAGGGQAVSDELIFGGGRATGGDLKAEEFVEINEGGIPELANINGRNFLFPGGDGDIQPAVSARDVFGTGEGGSSSVSSSRTINYNGDIVISVPEGTDAEGTADLMFEAIEDFHESQTISDTFKDSI